MDKKLKKNMKALFDLIVDEAEKNEEFAEALSRIFNNETPEKRPRIIQERKELLIEETRQFSILLSWQKMVS